MKLKDIEKLLTQNDKTDTFKQWQINEICKLKENDWIDILEYLVKKLSEATSTHIYLGEYWTYCTPEHKEAGFGSRIKAKQSLPDIESDYWEAAFSFIGSQYGTWIGADIFPFLNGVRISQNGKVEQSESEDAEIYWSYVFDSGQFINKGWTRAEGPGEWSWMLKPNDEYSYNAQCKLVENEIKDNEPILLDIKIPKLQKILSSRNQQKNNLRISLIHVNRSHENTNLVPWNEFLPKSNSRYILTLAEAKIIKTDTIQTNLRDFKIRGGWKRGKYLFSIRLQNTEEDWQFNSEISAPMKVSIL